MSYVVNSKNGIILKPNKIKYTKILKTEIYFYCKIQNYLYFALRIAQIKDVKDWMILYDVVSTS